MKKKLLYLLLAAALLAAMLGGCVSSASGDGSADVYPVSDAAVSPSASPAPAAGTISPEASPESPVQGSPQGSDKSISRDGHYTSPQDVAEYIHIYGTLPDNFISKRLAKELGWDSSQGNLWDVAPGMSIGGDYFGNYEGLLPEDDEYRECDVNYSGGYRGSERIIYGESGSIYYTADHYESFTQLY